MKILSFFSVIIMMFIGPSKCSEAQKIQKNPPMPLGKTYVEAWTSTTKPTDSGFNLVIHINNKDDRGITLDSVFFRNQYAKLIMKTTDSSSVYVGQFENSPPANVDIILSDDPIKEMKNVPPTVPKKTPFKLKPTEAMVSYRMNGEVRYFKIEDIREKSSGATPKE